jgi:hypothetical protein
VLALEKARRENTYFKGALLSANRLKLRMGGKYDQALAISLSQKMLVKEPWSDPAEDMETSRTDHITSSHVTEDLRA